MTAEKNSQILLASRPRGEPTPDNFRLVETDVPQPGPGQMLLRTIYLSLDPYMRGRMNAGCGSRKPRRPAGSTQKGPVSASSYRKRHDGIRRPVGRSAEPSALAACQR
jgi:NADPH-dependent curcumin reductase